MTVFQLCVQTTTVSVFVTLTSAMTVFQLFVQVERVSTYVTLIFASVPQNPVVITTHSQNKCCAESTHVEAARQSTSSQTTPELTVVSQVLRKY